MTNNETVKPEATNSIAIKVSTWFLRICMVWAILFYGLIASVVFFGTQSNVDARAIIGMAGGLLVLWVVLGSLLMFRFRDQIVRWVQSWPMGWKARFVLFCVLLSLLEEGIATALTNTAPLYGSVSENARITASTNFFEVVLLNSAIIFVPMFIAWAWMLARYAFHPLDVMILFGITGLVAEAISLGTHLAMAGMWIWVYGLMIYLPACTVPANRIAKPVRWWHRLLAIILPVIAAAPFVPLIIMLNSLFS